MGKYIPIAKRSIHEQICHQEDLACFKAIRAALPPKEQVQMELSLHNCVFGPVLIGSHENKLVAVELGSDVDECYRNFINKWGNSNPTVTPRVNMKIVHQVLTSIDTGIIDPAIELDLYGTGTYFQRKVWETLRTIQPGSTMSYQEIAKAMQRPDSARAIGTACGANPIAIIIPCHRAIRADGKTGGFKWGEDIKRKLLDRERI
jgi:AraC family transcriptional regulator of adaptative response/methylated-DNA-[protein]-cysteine methyltransferase